MHQPPPPPFAATGSLAVRTRFTWRGVGLAVNALFLLLVGLAVIAGATVRFAAGEWPALIGIVLGLGVLSAPYNGLRFFLRRRPGRVLIRLDPDGVSTAPTWPPAGPARPLAWYEVAGCCLYSLRGGGLLGGLFSHEYLSFYPMAGSEPPPTRRELAISRASGVPPIAVRYATRVGSCDVAPEEAVRAAQAFRPGLPVVDLRRPRR